MVCAKLKSLGCIKKVVKWTTSFLLNGSLRMKRKLSIFNEMPARSRVLQDAVIAPILCLVVANDPPEAGRIFATSSPMT